MEKKKTKEEIKVKTVIFVPQTANSQLAKMLREEEKTLERMTGYRVKYVEKAGTSIGNLLCKSDHWVGRLCGRKECLLCYTKEKTGQNLSQSCTKRNVVYVTWCQVCMEEAEKRAEEKGKDNKRVKVYKYIGKSAKSSFKRGKEHLGDRRALNLRSHMLKHAEDRHKGLDLEKVEFRMEVLQYHNTVFESIKIRNNSKHHLQN